MLYRDMTANRAIAVPRDADRELAVNVAILSTARTAGHR
jgi:hypothetical protein